VFALGAQRLAAGRQNVQVRCAFEDPGGQNGGFVDDVLAVVEHQQHPLVLQTGDQAGQRIFGADFETEHGSQRARHKARVAERRQIDQPDAMLTGGDQRLGHGDGDRGLADAAGPDNAQQPVPL
jgi:hypothetical protein